jgi:uncharacterized protein (TIRG00374 family)
MQGLPSLSRRQLAIVAILLTITIVSLYFLIPKLAGLNQTWGQLQRGDALLLVLGGLLEALSIVGYAVLFGTVCGRGVDRIDWRTSITIPLAGIAAIRLFSAAGAGGVAVTAWALARAGMSRTMVASRMVANVVLQYAVYFAALIACGLGLWFHIFSGGGSFALTIVPAILGAGSVALVLSMALVPEDFERRLDRLVTRRGRIGRLAARLATAPAAVGAGVRTALVLVRERRLGLLGALAYWGFDIAVLGVCFKAFNQDLPGAVLVIGYFLGTVGSLLPLPGGVGGIEGGMIGAFVAFGIPADRAIVAVLAYRAISFWLPTVPGIIGYTRLRRTVRAWAAADGNGHA